MLTMTRMGTSCQTLTKGAQILSFNILEQFNEPRKVRHACAHSILLDYEWIMTEFYKATSNR